MPLFVYNVIRIISILGSEFDIIEDKPLDNLKTLVRTIPDYPKPGIMFRDVTTLLADAQGFKATIARLSEPYATEPVDAIVAIEARGFILGGAVADRLAADLFLSEKKENFPIRPSLRIIHLTMGPPLLKSMKMQSNRANAS